MMKGATMYNVNDTFVTISRKIANDTKRNIDFGSYIKITVMTNQDVTCNCYNDDAALKSSYHSNSFRVTKEAFDSYLKKGHIIEHVEKQQSRWKKIDANMAHFIDRETTFAITCLPLHLNVAKINVQEPSRQYFPAQSVVNVMRVGDKLFVVPDTYCDSNIVNFISREILSDEKAKKASAVISSAQEVKSLDVLPLKYSQDYDDKNSNIEVSYSSGLVEYYRNDKLIKSEVKKK